MKRRDFVATVSLGLAAGVPFIEDRSAARVESASNEKGTNAAAASPQVQRLEFATALGAAKAIRKKQISSAELTQEVFSRIDQHNPKLNAFAYLLREEALARAKQADEAQAHGRSTGVLHGVPIHVKESFAVAGRPCTFGIPALKNSKAPENSAAANRLRRRCTDWCDQCAA